MSEEDYSSKFSKLVAGGIQFHGIVALGAYFLSPRYGKIAEGVCS